MSAPIHAPADEAELAHVVAEAFAARTPLDIRGGGSKRDVGRPVHGAAVGTGGLSGITLYEPAELVIGARAGTPLAELTAALDANGQMLPFEPADWRGLLGSGEARPTVGGTVAANLSGPRRLMAGACRDALIGVRFVNGRGETIRNGGRVMKNVTGYDLVKLMAGSWGTLGIVTEAIFKLLPRPETSASLVWSGLTDEDAVALMSAAAGSPYEISAAAHWPAGDGMPARTVLRLENFAPSIAYRAERLARELKRHGAPDRLDEAASSALWRDIRDAAPLRDAAGAVWRVSVAPSRAPAVALALRQTGGAARLFDWGGGLVWAAAPETAEAAAAIRRAAAAQGGHATLVRGSEALRLAVPPFTPPAGPLAALTARIRAAFDPAGILNPGKMGE